MNSTIRLGAQAFVVDGDLSGDADEGLTGRFTIEGVSLAVLALLGGGVVVGTNPVVLGVLGGILVTGGTGGGIGTNSAVRDTGGTLGGGGGLVEEVSVSTLVGDVLGGAGEGTSSGGAGLALSTDQPVAGGTGGAGGTVLGASGTAGELGSVTSGTLLTVLQVEPGLADAAGGGGGTGGDGAGGTVSGAGSTLRLVEVETDAALAAGGGTIGSIDTGDLTVRPLLGVVTSGEGVNAIGGGVLGGIGGNEDVSGISASGTDGGGGVSTSAPIRASLALVVIPVVSSGDR